MPEGAKVDGGLMVRRRFWWGHVHEDWCGLHVFIGAGRWLCGVRMGRIGRSHRLWFCGDVWWDSWRGWYWGGARRVAQKMIRTIKKKGGGVTVRCIGARACPECSSEPEVSVRCVAGTEHEVVDILRGHRLALVVCVKCNAAWEEGAVVLGPCVDMRQLANN